MEKMKTKQYYFLRIINMKDDVIDYEIALIKHQAKAILDHWNMLSNLKGIILYSPLQKKQDLTMSTIYSAYLQLSKDIMYEIFMIETQQSTK